MFCFDYADVVNNFLRVNNDDPVVAERTGLLSLFSVEIERTPANELSCFLVKIDNGFFGLFSGNTISTEFSSKKVSALA